MEAPTSQLTGLKGSAANTLEPDTIAHLHDFSRVNNSTGQLFWQQTGTNTKLMLKP